MIDGFDLIDWRETEPDLARLKKRGLWIAIPLFALCVGMGFFTLGGR